jgi:hypothetical protein
MTKLSKEDRPTYILSYPGWIRWGRIGLVLLLSGAALVRWVLEWVHFVRPLARGAELIPQALRPLAAGHVGLLLTAGAVAFVYALLPDLALADDGLAVRTITGWRVIPWRAITAVRIAPFEGSNRRLVLVQGQWARWSPWPRLVSMCLGTGYEPGVLMTSAIRDFGPLMDRMRQEVSRAAPEAIFDDNCFSLPARLVLEPAPTLAGLVDQAREEGWPFSLSAQAMAAVAGSLTLVQVLIMILVGGAWWEPLAVIGLAAAEWLIGTLYLYAVAEVFTGNVELREAALLYPLPQIPRALLALLMAIFVVAGVPFLAAMLGLVGVLWAVILTALMVQQIYRLKSILPAMAGGALQALFQFITLAIILSG